MVKAQHPLLTAIGKPTSVFALLKRWEDSKPMIQWASDEVLVWFCKEAKKYDFEYENINLTNFRDVNGSKLLEMKRREFLDKDRQYGNFLFQIVNSYKNEKIPKEVKTIKKIRLLDENTGNNKMSSLRKIRLPKERNKRKKCGRVWEFIRDLLLNPEFCPSIICWEQYEKGIFRFVQSSKVAELWGKKKNNPKMNFENFSRAIRQNYSTEYLQQVKKRLLYAFGPKATGWQTDNPNFHNNTK